MIRANHHVRTGLVLLQGLRYTHVAGLQAVEEISAVDASSKRCLEVAKYEEP